MWKRALVFFGSAALLAACNNPAYFEGFERLEVDQAMIDAAAMEDGGGHPVVGAYVQTEYWLDFSPPTAAELAELQPEGAEPVDMVPWVKRDDYELSVQWTLRNETDRAVDRVFVTLDGASEFYDYNPIPMYGLAGGEDADEVPFPSLLGFTPRHLDPGETLRGEFREDDMHEAMLDLDALSRYCGGPFAVINNRSEVDPIGTESIPQEADIAGMVMVRLTLGSSGPVTLDYSIRVRDGNDVLYDSAHDDTRYDPMPEPFVISAGGAADPTAPMATCMAEGGGG
jgi:hypothetical protein